MARCFLFVFLILSYCSFLNEVKRKIGVCMERIAQAHKHTRSSSGGGRESKSSKGNRWFK